MRGTEAKPSLLTGRLLSLDVMRGLIMVLLAAESCMLYQSLWELNPAEPFKSVIQQFFHHPWHGLRFWDLVQPGFMMMAGSAMYLSFYKKAAKGISWEQNVKHIAVRCLKLFLLGTGLHCLYAGRLVWELWNVLTQLSVTTLIAYLIIRKSYTFQIVFSFGLLILTEILYRTISVPGFDQPFVEHHNFGAYADLLLMGKINSDGWVAINVIPTAAHTIWGVLAGKLLVSSLNSEKKILYLVAAGLLGLAAGFGLDISGITPIIKRISTSSFVLASGGWILLLMVFLYWLTDIRQKNKYAWILTSVGMNAIFIYVFFETAGHQWLNPSVGIFVNGFAGMLAVPASVSAVLSASVTLALEWYICFWLYSKKIFIKL